MVIIKKYMNDINKQWNTFNDKEIYESYEMFFEAINENKREHFLFNEFKSWTYDKVKTINVIKGEKMCLDLYFGWFKTYLKNYFSDINRSYPNFDDFYFLSRYFEKLEDVYRKHQDKPLLSIFEDNIEDKEKFFNLCKKYLFENYRIILGKLRAEYPSQTFIELQETEKVDDTIKKISIKTNKVINTDIRRIK